MVYLISIKTGLIQKMIKAYIKIKNNRVVTTVEH